VQPIVELEIHDVAFGGAGVARADGKVYFVPFTAPGDRVRAAVVRDKKKFAEAEVVELLTPGPGRVKPPCIYFTRCGGCAYQHLDYALQLEFKQAQVEQTLRRLGKLAEVPMRPIVPSPQPYAFRNRVRVHVRDGQAGFYAHRSHALVPIARCEIAQPAVNEALENLRRSVVPDGDYTLRAGDRSDFFEQTNDAVAAQMLALVERSLSPGHTLVVDAYCGAGFFAHRLAATFPEVVGLEENHQAVAYAARRAAPHERYLAGDVAFLLGDVLRGRDPDKAAVVVDPPAVGLAPRVVDILLACAPAEIIYVSCDPATLARDLGLLSRYYRIESVTPLDMFPQTAEVEVVTVLRRFEPVLA
jgi:23S rRNA (uracil1939-C5)-methyltransferase